MTTQFAVVEEYGKNSFKQLMQHDTEIMNIEARLTLQLIERWGMAAGVIDGEDSAGRAILRSCDPGEVVDRACATAEMALTEIRKRGWIQEGPDISDLLRKVDD